MKDFIIQNYKLILLFLAFIGWLINFLILLIKKSDLKVEDNVFTQLLLRLPVMIRSVEETGKTGAEKKTAVLFYALRFIADFTGLKDSVVTDLYSDRISEAIESILTTPQKKEEN